MKHMNIKKRYYPLMDLQLFADDPDNGPDGEDSGDGDDQDDDADEGGDEDEDERRFSQKEVDEAVKKRLAREKRKWQRQQKQGDKPGNEDKPGKVDAGETEADKKAREAEEKATALELKWTCLEHDVRKDCVDDVLALARVHVSKDSSLDIEDAIDKVLEKYPQFKDGYEDDDLDEDDGKKKGWGQRHGKPPKKSATVDDEIRKQLFGK